MYPIIMYMRVSTKRRQGKTYQYLQLCEAYRNEAGQPRTRVLINFGRMDQLDRKMIDTAVEALLAYSADPRVPRLQRSAPPPCPGLRRYAGVGAPVGKIASG